MIERFVEYKDQILVFARNFLVSFGNNSAEQAIRMMKLKQKISGCFRSEQGAKDFADLTQLYRYHEKTRYPNHTCTYCCPSRYSYLLNWLNSYNFLYIRASAYNTNIVDKFDSKHLKLSIICRSDLTLLDGIILFTYFKNEHLPKRINYYFKITF